MTRDQQLADLVDAAKRGRLSRRTLLRRAGALGISTATLGALVGVQFPLFWSGLLGAAIAAALTDLAAGERLYPPRWLHLIVRVALGCLVGTALVPALAYPTLLPSAIGPVLATAGLWAAGAAIIARLSRVDLATALLTPAPRGRSRPRWRYVVPVLLLARGLGVLLITAWLTQ